MAGCGRKVPFLSLSTIAEITDFLFLSSLSGANKEDLLKEKGITHVINGMNFRVYIDVTASSTPQLVRFAFECVILYN